MLHFDHSLWILGLVWRSELVLDARNGPSRRDDKHLSRLCPERRKVSKASREPRDARVCSWLGRNVQGHMHKTVRRAFSSLDGGYSGCSWCIFSATRQLADQQVNDEDRKMLRLEANTWDLLQRVYELVSLL